MIKWSVYQTDKHRSISRKDVMNTLELIMYLLLDKKSYIVNINKKQDKKSS